MSWPGLKQENGFTTVPWNVIKRNEAHGLRAKIRMKLAWMPRGFYGAIWFTCPLQVPMCCQRN